MTSLLPRVVGRIRSELGRTLDNRLGSLHKLFLTTADQPAKASDEGSG